MSDGNYPTLDMSDVLFAPSLTNAAQGRFIFILAYIVFFLFFFLYVFVFVFVFLAFRFVFSRTLGGGLTHSFHLLPVAHVIDLPQGKYNIMAATYQPDEENTFTLRILGDKATLSPLQQAYYTLRAHVRGKKKQIISFVFLFYLVILCLYFLRVSGRMAAMVGV